MTKLVNNKSSTIAINGVKRGFRNIQLSVQSILAPGVRTYDLRPIIFYRNIGGEVAEQKRQLKEVGAKGDECWRVSLLMQDNIISRLVA